MRRLLAAAAALMVMAGGSLMWAQPAQAAPTGPCSIEEWSNPGNFAGCASRMRAAATGAAGCVTAPTPGNPTAGMAGWFASEPDSAKRNGVTGRYSMYGVGGYGLDTYDIGCLGTIKHPGLVGWNTSATFEFKSAAGVLGAANALREWAYDPGSVWGWADPLIQQVTTAVFNNVFPVFGVLTLAGIGLYLLWSARHGRMSETMKLTAWAVFILVATMGLARWPVTSVHAADKVAETGLTVVHSVLGPGPQDIPAGQCADPEPDACVDHRTVATRSSDVAVNTILYRSWLRAVLGDADSPTARKYGPALYDATAMTWGEAERADQSPALRQQLLTMKADNFNSIAAQIKVEDPQAYEYLQGTDGSDRFWDGFIAVVSAFAFALYDAAASLVILFGFGVFRIAVMLLPLLATFGLFQPASGMLRRIINAVTAALFNIVVFGAASGANLLIDDRVFSTTLLPDAAKPFIVILVGVGLLLASHPIRQFVSTATGRPRDKDGLITRAYQGGKQLITDRSREHADTATGAGPGERVRPETISQPARSVGRTAVDVFAPSVAEARNSQLATAATDAAGQGRPEGTSTTAHWKQAGSSLLSKAATVVTPAGDGPVADQPAEPARRRPSPRPRAENRS
jgi:multisubunit Na+/H+ antiporter MnhC subunit